MPTDGGESVRGYMWGRGSPVDQWVNPCFNREGRNVACVLQIYRG